MIGEFIGPFIAGLGLSYVVHDNSWKNRFFGVAITAAGIVTWKYL